MVQWFCLISRRLEDILMDEHHTLDVGSFWHWNWLINIHSHKAIGSGPAGPALTKFLAEYTKIIKKKKKNLVLFDKVMKSNKVICGMFYVIIISLVLFVRLAVFVSVRLDSYFQNAIAKFWGSFRVFACNIVREPFAMAWHICIYLYWLCEWSLWRERNLYYSHNFLKIFLVLICIYL